MSKEDRKSLKVLPNPNGSLYVIVWEGGGQVPGELCGLYTTIVDAKRAIVSWYAMNKREDQVAEPIAATTVGDLEDAKFDKRAAVKATLKEK